MMSSRRERTIEYQLRRPTWRLLGVKIVEPAFWVFLFLKAL